MSTRILTCAATLAILVFVSVPLHAADSPRVRQTMDFGWKFKQSNPDHAEAIGLDDSQWLSVDLPHDWSIFGPFDTTANPNAEAALPAGMGWYRKILNIPAEDKGKQIFLEFDGIYEYGQVFINGHEVGMRPYGYTSVCYDVTQFANIGGDNTIAVKVDNTRQPNSRWYPGSGIYRHTWLIATDPLHIPQWGTYVTTPNVTADSATVSIQIQVANQRTLAAQYELVSTIIDSAGTSIATISDTGQLDAGANGSVSYRITIPKPNLWSTATDHPSMYTLRSQVKVGGAVVDQYDTPFGIRSLDYDVDKGLLINGEHVKLDGVCLHSDGGAVGVAVPEGIWVRRLATLKAMGCNAIRWAHTPPDPAVLDLCDQMGFAVMDEAYDEWTGDKTGGAGRPGLGSHVFFADWHVRDTTDFIHRDRNHPSVVLWSAGNEIHPEQTTPDGWMVLKELVDIFHKEDPTRPVTSACDNLHAQPTSTTLQFLALQDVVGYNYPNRWAQYGFLYMEPDRRLFPDRKFIATEDGTIGGGLRGSYGDPFAAANPPATQPAAGVGAAPAGRGGFGGGRGGGAPNITAENLWKNVAVNDYVVGDFMWTGIDYLGEGVPGSNSGVIDRIGIPKDGYYFYQSQWTAKPMVHIFPHWTWPGHEGQTLTVYAYTNCDSVQLFVNGKPYATKGYRFPAPGQGTLPGAAPAAGRGAGPGAGRGPGAAAVAGGVPTTRGAAPGARRGVGFAGGGRGGGVVTTSDLHLSWDVTYQPGTIRAVGTKGGVTVTDEISTAGDPVALDMQVDKTSAMADGHDVVHVVIRVVDAKGITVPNADPLVNFSVQGEAKIIGVDNGSSSIEEYFKPSDPHAGQRTALNGMCMAIVQTTQTSGAIHVTAHADGLKDASQDVQSSR